MVILNQEYKFKLFIVVKAETGWLQKYFHVKFFNLMKRKY